MYTSCELCIMWSTYSISVYSGCGHTLANDGTLLNYQVYILLETCAYEVYFVKTYIVKFHMITALCIALWRPGSLPVDVCGIGLVFRIYHNSYRGLNVRLKLRSTGSTRFSQLPLLGCRLV